MMALQLRVVILGLLVVSTMFACQERLERTVADNDLPDSCAVRGQECPTTTSVTARAAE